MNRLFSPEEDSVGRIYDQLAHLVKIMMPPIPGSVQMLTREQISELIETAFWASLRSQEGRTTRFCIIVLTPEMGLADNIAFAIPVAYDVAQITKIAPAVPHKGCLVVSASSERLSIWGFGRSRPGSWLATITIEVTEPGIVRVGIGPFKLFAVLDGQSNPIIEGSGMNLAAHLQRVLQKDSSNRQHS